MFNEHEMFKGNKDELVQALHNDVRDLSLEEISRLLDHINEGNLNGEMNQNDELLEEGTQY